MKNTESTPWQFLKTRILEKQREPPRGEPRRASTYVSKIWKIRLISKAVSTERSIASIKWFGAVRKRMLVTFNAEKQKKPRIPWSRCAHGNGPTF